MWGASESRLHYTSEAESSARLISASSLGGASDPLTPMCTQGWEQRSADDLLLAGTGGSWDYDPRILLHQQYGTIGI